MDISDQISKKLYLSEKKTTRQNIKNRSKKEVQFKECNINENKYKFLETHSI